MHAKSTAAATLLSAALASAGSAVVKNQCGFPAYLWSVSNYAAQMTTLQPSESYSEVYRTNPNGGGVSLKISTEPDSYGSVTQLEYTAGATLFYDMSNINGNPFMKWGMSLVPSSNACRNVLCPAGVEECSDAYNTPDQNWATAACDMSSNLVLVLCSGQDNDKTPVASAKNAIGDALNVDIGEPKHTHPNKHPNKHHNHHNNSQHEKNHGSKPHNHKDKAPKPAPKKAPKPAPKPAPKKAPKPAPEPAPKKAPKPAPEPAPEPAPAPAVVASAQVGAATTFVTQIVTVTARDANPSAAPEAHAHANYHRHHFHRHS